jgi:hypothetical protein
MRGCCLAVLLVVAILASGCRDPGTGMTPEGAALRVFAAEGAGRQVAGTRQAPGGVVVLYGERAADPVPTYDIGYAFVERRTLRWEVRGGISASMSPGEGDRAAYLIGHLGSVLQADAETPTILFGRILDPGVAAARVRLSTGEAVDDVLTGGMFAVVSAPLVAPCTIQFLDGTGMLVHEVDLSAAPQPGFPPEWTERIEDQCQATAGVRKGDERW